ncbi:hypothetical protein [Comamonas jiangduensis]|uniref:hypothetical protein n=1 Tax=Comamonas jiangduensis TaxID=1194168 RepID=UPI003BF8217B
MKKANLSVSVRVAFHAVYREWVASANDDEYQRLMVLREQIAPGEVCSAVSLVLHCLEQSELVNRLPSRLYQLLQERGWLQALDDDRAAAG